MENSEHTFQSSRSDGPTVAVGFNPPVVKPRNWLRRVATIENQPSLRDGKRFGGPTNRGLKPTATFKGRYATEITLNPFTTPGKESPYIAFLRELKGLDGPRRTEAASPADGPIPLAAIVNEDLRSMSDVQLAALEMEIDAQLRTEAAGKIEPAGVHALHQAGLPRRTGTTRNWPRCWTGWRRASAGG